MATRRQNGHVPGSPTPLAASPDTWEESKRRGQTFSDDGTMTFFWRAHRITALVIFCAALLYVTIVRDTPDDSVTNTKRGLVACMIVLVTFGVTHMPDGPFRRPHPAFWKVVLVLSIMYELCLVFLLFQKPDDARQLLKHIDPTLGRPMPEKSYGGNCKIYDPDHADGPWHNIRDKMDIFVPVHFIGWWFKTLVLRDYWLCTVISVMFELLEYTFEHQLPNFSECWWDHWIMDALVCNGLGIYLGMKTLNYLKMKPYHWRGTWNINTYRGKVWRIARQFTPYYWIDFSWRPTSSLRRWLAATITFAVFLVAELNTFYLKYSLWLAPAHPLCFLRLACFLLWAACGMREFFQFLDDTTCKKLGTQYWMTVAIIITEALITVKFEWETITKPLPYHVTICWVVGLLALALWTMWNFYGHRLFHHLEAKVKHRNRKLRAAAAHGDALPEPDVNANVRIGGKSIRARANRPLSH